MLACKDERALLLGQVPHAHFVRQGEERARHLGVVGEAVSESLTYQAETRLTQAPSGTTTTTYYVGNYFEFTGVTEF